MKIIEFDAEDMARRALHRAKSNGAEAESPKPFEWADTTGWDTEPCPARDWAVLDRIPLRQVTLVLRRGRHRQVDC